MSGGRGRGECRWACGSSSHNKGVTGEAMRMGGRCGREGRGDGGCIFKEVHQLLAASLGDGGGGGHPGLHTKEGQQLLHTVMKFCDGFVQLAAEQGPVLLRNQGNLVLLKAKLSQVGTAVLELNQQQEEEL